MFNNYVNREVACFQHVKFDASNAIILNKLNILRDNKTFVELEARHGNSLVGLLHLSPSQSTMK